MQIPFESASRAGALADREVIVESIDDCRICSVREEFLPEICEGRGRHSRTEQEDGGTDEQEFSQ